MPKTPPHGIRCSVKDASQTVIINNDQPVDNSEPIQTSASPLESVTTQLQTAPASSSKKGGK
jgi:hypothetical protein